jgi:glycosyltransferase involved in cell wall biosynthesis
MKILFVVPYPLGRSPSQRFRFEQYFNVLTAAGYDFKTESFYNNAGWRAIYSSGNIAAKLFAIIRGFIKRTFLLFRLAPYEYIFLHREATPLGPPVFEWAAAKLFGKKIIFDFDDAIWTTDNLSENSLSKLIRWRSKTNFICKAASVVSCGNGYLADYAKQFNKNVIINPTTIDTNYHIRRTNESRAGVVIGWTGSHSTLKYLDEMLPAIAQLEMSLPGLIFKVIADRDPKLQMASFRFVRFSEENEIADLSDLDIGIMPLPDDEWAKGKCGFKALQYMALGIPAVASPVGVNTGIIKDGENGFLCSSINEWIDKLTILISDAALRQRMGTAGRQAVEKNYSVNSNCSNFLGLFELSASNTSASR